VILNSLTFPEISSWDFEIGKDASGYYAIQVWGTVSDSGVPMNTLAKIRDDVRNAVGRKTKGKSPWVYVWFRDPMPQ
jgi:hypothetical protein